jgi:chromosome segregation ATPase
MPSTKQRSNASAKGFENDHSSLNTRRGLLEDLQIDLTKKDMPALKETMPESIPTAKSLRNGNRNHAGDSTAQDDVDYLPRWASSSNNKYALDHSDQLSLEEDNASSDDDRLLPVNELPSFADAESKELHKEIKLLEQRREDAAKSARSHRERRGVINDQVRSIQQEIEHTNSLVAAKKDEIETEEHLLSLSQRELGQRTRDILSLDDSIIATQEKIARCENQIVSAKDELEKLKTDLNLNQEELEQWATAATKKEEEYLLLQKFTMADELKIKELILTIEDLTKVSVEKKSLLENELTETQSNQSELDKLAERFKSRHEERRQLIPQWKATIDSMNNRDQAISLLAAQYEKLSQQEDEAKITLAQQKRQHEMLGVRKSVEYHL